MQGVQYVALGSSFAAGPAIPPVLDAAAMRSGRNYAHLLADALGAALTDATVSGATTDTIVDQPQVVADGTRFPPQLGAVTEATDLVTITAGGNDLRYAGSMMFAAWNRADPHGQIAQTLAPEYAGRQIAPTPRDVDEAAAGLARVVERVRERAPRARVVLVDYLTVIGEQTRPDPGAPFTEPEIEAFRAIQAGLEAAHARAAQHSSGELLAVSAVSRDHGLGAQQPRVSAFSRDPEHLFGSFHPNAAGMAVVAGELAALLGAAGGR